MYLDNLFKKKRKKIEMLYRKEEERNSDFFFISKFELIDKSISQESWNPSVIISLY